MPIQHYPELSKIHLAFFSPGAETAAVAPVVQAVAKASYAIYSLL
jgi:hypothetical protein